MRVCIDGGDVVEGCGGVDVCGDVDDECGYFVMMCVVDDGDE